MHVIKAKGYVEWLCIISKVFGSEKSSRWPGRMESYK